LNSLIRADAEKQWQMLPKNYKLMTSLKDCQRSPFERDFLAGTRLDYLHTLFLLHLVSFRQTSEPNDVLLRIASDMLSLVVEVIVLRDRLVNSGTCLIWKVHLCPITASSDFSKCVDILLGRPLWLARRWHYFFGPIETVLQ
jgi:hypothetical protein